MNGRRWQARPNGLWIFALAGILLGADAAEPAFADGRDDDEARALYQLGQERFKSGKYEAAIEALRAGYDKVPRPEFLLNLGQCYRALGRTAEAIPYYRKFIDQAPAHPLRAAAERTLRDLERQDPPKVVAKPPPADQPPSLGIKPEETPASPALRVSEKDEPRAPPPHASSHKWFYVIGSVVLAIGGGTALYFATRAEDTNNLGTLHLPPP